MLKISNENLTGNYKRWVRTSMIIHSLTMENFRQFYGRQKIEFAQSKEQEVVTVVLGENGRGKTGIYRAMMLALFGDRKLLQDAQEAEIYLANINAVEESSENGEGVYCTVQLDFEHHGENFTIERVYFAMKDAAGTQKEQLHKVSLINHATKDQWFSEREIKEIIQRMIDDRVKHYFFFDGERIERLTRVSAQQKQEVAFGIKNLLKIDQVLKSRDVLQKVLTKVKKELEQHSTGDYKKAFREQTNLQEKLEKLERKYQRLEQAKTDAQARQAEIDQILHESDSIQENIEERDQLEIQLEHTKNNLTAKFEQVKSLNKYLPLLVGEDVYHRQLAKLSKELSIEMEEGISSEFVEQLLENLRCICGTSFDQDSEQHEQLTSLATSVKRYEKHKDLYELNNELKQLTAYIDGRVDQIRHARDEICLLQAEQDQIIYKLEEINHQLGDSVELEIKQLNDERNETVQEILEIDHKKTVNKEKQQKYEEKIERLSFTLKELEQRSGLHKQLLLKYNVLEQAVETMDNMIKKFEMDLMEELELASKQNLYYLLDEAGQEMIQEVKITDNYTLEVLNNFGQPFLANISQGQRQVLSISFISALAQVAGGRSTLEMPLFMDTPFGRLSGKHQQNLIEYLPKICSQWVLLVTDKEFGKAEQQQFIESKTIGKFYELVAEKPGVTKIKEVQEVDYKEGVTTLG